MRPVQYSLSAAKGKTDSGKVSYSPDITYGATGNHVTCGIRPESFRPEI